jgi:tetratricopeptide (TPR) repeat protein
VKKAGRMQQERQNLHQKILEACLNHVPKYENVRRQGFFQKYCACELLKNEGNKHFNRHETSRAIECYLQAFSIFACPGVTENTAHTLADHLNYENFERKSERERSMFKKIKVTLFLNLAQCYLFLQEYEIALEVATEALILSPNNVKAL